MFIFGVASARLSARYGARHVLLAAAAISAVGYSLLAFAHQEPWQVYLAALVLGVSLGLGFSALSNLIVIAVPAEQTGVATGMNANIRTIGGSIGAAVAGTIITSQLLANGFPAQSGYTRGFAVLAVVSVVATFAVLVVPKVRPGAPVITELPHPELALVAAGTLRGDESE
jgi:MFS family permease